MDKDALLSVFSDASRDGWTLRSDIQLQEWLEDFAERLKERTKEVAAEVHRLGTEAGNVELLLQNNFNSLRALSATQFIENRVDEVDEVFVNKSEQPPKQSRVESYDSHIIPRYKEAVLTAWDAFEGFSTRKTSRQSSNVRSRIHQAKPLMKLPYIIGTEEFYNDSHCGLGDFKSPDVDARAPSSEPVESGSDTDRDEARMAAEMVGGRTWLEGEWFATESETSSHQGGVLEPAVSAALDFKAMLEAALRGPSFPYDGGNRPNLESEHEQHSYESSPLTSAAHDTDSITPRTRSSSGEIKLDGDSSPKHGEVPVEQSVQDQNQELASETVEELKQTFLVQPSPIPMSPAFSGSNYGHATASTGPQSPSVSTPRFTPSSRDGIADDPEHSPRTSPRSDSPPQRIMSAAATAEPSLSLNPRTEESKPPPPPASEFRPSAVPDDLPMPTLPDGLFQGLQVAIQARQLKSQRPETPQEGKPDERMASAVPAEKSFTVRRPSPLKLKPKENRGFPSKVETTSRLQKDVPATSKKAPGPISFQGGLFDDEDDDESDEVSSFLSKEGTTLTPQNEVTKLGEIFSSPLTLPLTSGSSSTVRKGLFDDFGDLSVESPSESEVVGASSAGLVERASASSSQQTGLSFPDRKDANRSRVLNKSLFGDSDEEDGIFGE